MESGSDDRSAALVSTALADTALIMGIAVLRRARTPEDFDALFWKRKAKHPTFDSRIREGWRLNLIGPRTKNNLSIVRHVRNAFAYSMVEVRFDTSEIANACDQIVL